MLAAITLRIQETTMIAMNSSDVEDVKVGAITYKGKSSEVKGVSVRWLSRVGQDSEGAPAYGLRLFTIGPGGEIPIHNHAYVQTMYIVSGEFECWDFDPETEAIRQKVVCGPGTSIYIPSMAPHGMKNVSAEAGTFLCCIGNVYEDQE